MKSNKPIFSGFTLIELILTVSIIAIISSAVIPIASSFIVKNSFSNKSSELLNAIRIAQLNSLYSKENDSWSVRSENKMLTVFKGQVYGDRDSKFDIVYRIPDNIAVSDFEIIFERQTGFANEEVFVVLQSLLGDEVSFAVNRYGAIETN
jgi:prepilin-type N-terminal cleavage/methylation domain-containing protein